MTDPVAEDPRVVALVEHILAEKARDGDEAEGSCEPRWKSCSARSSQDTIRSSSW
jgi:hypothetical protein